MRKENDFGVSAFPATSMLAAYTTCRPAVETSAPDPAYGHPDGRSANLVGAAAGSSTHRVSETPEPPASSAAPTERRTVEAYDPLCPFGVDGEAPIVVVGVTPSGA